jgi:hypothetical protein
VGAGQGGSSEQGGSAGRSSGGAGASLGGSGPQAGAGDGSGGQAGGESGGVSGAAGAGAGDGGAGGAAPPEWRPVGPSPLEDPPTLSEPDFELAPDGTPYLAFRGCEDCDISTLIPIPVVERFDGSWRVLPTDGLPSTIRLPPSLALGGDGTPYLLVDGVVSGFDGQRWSSEIADSPAEETEESNFQVDLQGDFWVTAFDWALQEITVMRSNGSSFEPVGPAVPGRSSGVRLALGDVPYLAHTDADGAGVFVRRFTGSAWEGDEMAGESVNVFAEPDGTLHVSIWVPDNASRTGGRARVLSGTAGALAEIATVDCWFRAPTLSVAPDRSLYQVFLVESYVNVDRWDGQNFRDVGENPIDTGSPPLIRFAATDEGHVPYLAYKKDLALEVKKYE